MQCIDCRLQGVSCPYAFMVVPGGQVPDPCPYRLGKDFIGSFLDAPSLGYAQIIYPEWNSEEIEKELRRFFNDLVKSLTADSVPLNMKDVKIKVEAQKLMEWVCEKHKSESATITLTTTSQNGGDGE